MTSAVIFQIQSFCILVLITIGILKRKDTKNPKLHSKVMLMAIIWDVLLILQIELSRSAVAKAMKIPSNPTILNIHVGLALTTVLLYIHQYYSGKKIAKMRSNHAIIGPIVYVLRLLTFVTSFYAHQA